MADAVISRGKRRNYLWVEGKDDEVVIYSLLNSHSITAQNRPRRFITNNEPFEIKEHDGINNLIEALRTELKGDVVEHRYGVIVDVDDSLDNTWKRLQDSLNVAGYQSIPTIPDANGTILQQEGSPVIGIWIMPDNKLPGMMEDFISFLGPQSDQLWPVAIEVMQKVMDTKCNFRPTYKSKACLHTWLAWQEVPGRPMGQAITLKYADATAAHAQQFIAWFRKLFELQSQP